MSATIHRLPGTSTSYYTIRKNRSGWDIQLVTPAEGSRALRTSIARSGSRDAAIEYGEQVARDANRPFRLPKTEQGQ